RRIAPPRCFVGSIRPAITRPAPATRPESQRVRRRNWSSTRAWRVVARCIAVTLGGDPAEPAALIQNGPNDSAEIEVLELPRREEVRGMEVSAAGQLPADDLSPAVDD